MICKLFFCLGATLLLSSAVKAAAPLGSPSVKGIAAVNTKAPDAVTAPATSTFDKKKPLEKIPKSLFLVKKIKMSPDVGEPQFNPQEAQLRTVINDPVLHNTKKFE